MSVLNDFLNGTHLHIKDYLSLPPPIHYCFSVILSNKMPSNLQIISRETKSPAEVFPVLKSKHHPTSAPSTATLHHGQCPSISFFYWESCAKSDTWSSLVKIFLHLSHPAPSSNFSDSCLSECTWLLVTAESGGGLAGRRITRRHLCISHLSLAPAALTHSRYSVLTRFPGRAIDVKLAGFRPLGKLVMCGSAWSWGWPMLALQK